MKNRKLNIEAVMLGYIRAAAENPNGYSEGVIGAELVMLRNAVERYNRGEEMP